VTGPIDPRDATLAERFPLPADTSAERAALAARLEEFRAALARGGTRAQFAHWQAAHDVLAAALSILTPAARRAAIPTFYEGEARWPLRTAASPRR
jgi:hypothetical protein